MFVKPNFDALICFCKTDTEKNPLRETQLALALNLIYWDGLGSEIKQIYNGEGALCFTKAEPPPAELLPSAAFCVVQMVGWIEDLGLCAEDPQSLWRPGRWMWVLDRA